MSSSTWIVVLIKDFGAANTRLASVLAPEARRTLAVANARRALDSALQVAPTLAVCGSIEAGETATACGAEVIVEGSPRGQNAAASLGLTATASRGGDAALILSSDLPLVDAAALDELLAHAAAVAGPLAVAAAALARHGTNALYLRPLSDFELQFGDQSLWRFAAEARRRGRAFIVHDDRRLALDIDEPSDVVMWEQLRETA